MVNEEWRIQFSKPQADPGGQLEIGGGSIEAEGQAGVEDEVFGQLIDSAEVDELDRLGVRFGGDEAGIFQIEIEITEDDAVDGNGVFEAGDVAGVFGVALVEEAGLATEVECPVQIQ